MFKIISNKGITLIALIVTIVVILIITNVALFLLNGDNGILIKSQTAVGQTNEAQAKESLNLTLQEAKIEKIQNTTFNPIDDLNQLLQQEIDQLDINSDIVTVSGYSFKIDRNSFSIIESLGKGIDITTTDNQSLIGKTSYITSSGYSNIDILGKTSSGTVESVTYSAHTIVYNGNLVLDGVTQVTGATLTSNVYEFGDNLVDVGTSSADATNMVIFKVNGNLTINSGITVTSCKSSSGYGGTKGMMIYCTGTLINDGTISMTARGAKAAGQDVYLWKNNDGSFEYIPALSGVGGASVSLVNAPCINKTGVSGVSGINRGTGGRRFWRSI